MPQVNWQFERKRTLFRLVESVTLAVVRLWVNAFFRLIDQQIQIWKEVVAGEA